jgi:hypothetical protein
MYSSISLDKSVSRNSSKSSEQWTLLQLIKSSSCKAKIMEDFFNTWYIKMIKIFFDWDFRETICFVSPRLSQCFQSWQSQVHKTYSLIFPRSQSMRKVAIFSFTLSIYDKSCHICDARINQRFRILFLYL